MLALLQFKQLGTFKLYYFRLIAFKVYRNLMLPEKVLSSKFVFLKLSFQGTLGTARYAFLRPTLLLLLIEGKLTCNVICARNLLH